MWYNNTTAILDEGSPMDRKVILTTTDGSLLSEHANIAKAFANTIAAAPGAEVTENTDERVVVTVPPYKWRDPHIQTAIENLGLVFEELPLQMVVEPPLDQS